MSTKDEERAELKTCMDFILKVRRALRETPRKISLRTSQRTVFSFFAKFEPFFFQGRKMKINFTLHPIREDRLRTNERVAFVIPSLTAFTRLASPTQSL